MTRFVALALALGITGCGVEVASAQGFDLGHLGFGLLGGGPGLGIGSASTDTGTTTAAGTGFGHEAERPGQLTGSFGAATESFGGSELGQMPARLVPEDIPVGHVEEITSGR